MLIRIIKTVSSFLKSLRGGSPLERRIITAGSFDRDEAKRICSYLSGESSDGKIGHRDGLEEAGRVLLQEFSRDSEEMIRFCELLRINKQEQLIFPLVFAGGDLLHSLKTLSSTSITPCEAVKLYTQSVSFTEYSGHYKLFADFLLPGSEGDLSEMFCRSTGDEERSIWASIAVLSPGDLTENLKEHLRTLSFDTNSNYSLSALESSAFTEEILTKRIEEWLQDKELDKTGKISAMLRGGERTDLSANLTKQLRSDFYNLFIKGLKLNHREPFIKTLLWLGVQIDPDRTLAKLSARSVVKYVEQGYISFESALSFFILKGKGKHLEKLLELDYPASMEVLAHSEQLLLNSLAEIWSYDSAGAFKLFVKLIPTATDNARERMIKKMESCDSLDDLAELLASRRIMLRETAVQILVSKGSDAAKKLLEERLAVEKNSGVKAKLTEALKEPEDDTSVKSRVVELIMVTSSNNNKYYRMIDNGDRFTVEFGRVGGRSQKASYPISEWDKKYREKIRKGYSDNTKLFLKKSAAVEYKEIDDRAVKQVINDLMEYSNKTIFNNYTVTAENVTRQQVDRAQAIIDELAGRVKVRTDVTKLNELLLDLYQVIPRKMKNVNDHLYSKAGVGKDDIRDLEVLLSSEQDTLDAMSSKLRLIELEDDTGSDAKDITILEAMGLKMRQVDRSEEKKIRGMMRSTSGKYRRAYAVENVVTQNRFDAHVSEAKNSSTELYFHGSRNENFLNILQTGLMIRPSGAIYTGSMFGDGIYFADKAIKSLGYTSLRGSYWAAGSSNRGYMAIFNVHMGKQFEIKKHSSWCTTINEKILQDKGGYNSVFAKGGADLRNNEMIVYNSRQCTINYLIELG